MIDVQDISKSFNGRNVIDGLSFRVERGQLLCLEGPSGRGKTTTLRIIAGLELPSGGVVRIDGRVATGPRAWMPPERRGIGFMFQNFALWPHMRAWRQLDFVLRANRMGRAGRQARIDELLSRVGLNDRRDAWPADLSGGEQQRLAFVRAIAAQPRILLLDEPFSNLDGQLRQVVATEIHRYKHDVGAAIVVASHGHNTEELAADGAVRL